MKIGNWSETKPRPWWRHRFAIGLAVVMLLLFSGTALAAEVMGGNTYILPRGEVVSDDLYVYGEEIIIDGTVEGDLIVSGGYIEVNGVVMGDLLAAGGAVVINGVVQDDVRAAGGAVVLSGRVGDDFFAMAGGGWPGGITMPMVNMNLGGRSVPQGLQVGSSSAIGGDAYVAGGFGNVAGSIGRDLVAGFGTLIFSGNVARNAVLRADALTVSPNAKVQGTLRYTSDAGTRIPDGVASSVEAQPAQQGASATVSAPNPIAGFFWWVLRTILIVAGYLFVGWIVWSFAPRLIQTPLEVMEARPVEAGAFGLLLTMAVLPLGVAITFLAGLFWGWFPGGVFTGAFIFGFVSLLWLLSPVITGLWAGRLIAARTGVTEIGLPQLLVGIGAIVLAARLLSVIPCVGALANQIIFLVSLILTVGSWVLARRQASPSTAIVPVASTHVDLPAA